MAAVFIAALIAQTASASEHIFLKVAPNDNLGAGFGELSPGFHDLRVTVDISGGDYDMVWASDSSGMTMWDIETQTGSSVTLLSQDAQEDNMGAVTVEGMIMDPIDPAIMFPFYVGIANVLWPCADCGMDEFGMPLCAAPNNEMGMCDTSQKPFELLPRLGSGFGDSEFLGGRHAEAGRGKALSISTPLALHNQAVPRF